MKSITHLITPISLFLFSSFCLPAQYFTTPVPITTSTTMSVLGNVTTADLDGDGLMDVIGSAGTVNVFWFQNLGNNTFSTEKTIYDEEIFGENVGVMDVDRDQDPDIIAALGFGNEIVWVENLGDGEFGTGRLIVGGLDSKKDMVIHDLDNDGL